MPNGMQSLLRGAPRVELHDLGDNVWTCVLRTGNENAVMVAPFIIDISSSSRNKSLIILACQIVLQIDIRSGNQIILSDRKALLRSRVAVIFDKGWGRD